MYEPSENLPPELDDVGERMRAERPVADNHTLDRVMTRAQSARQAPKRSLWRSPAPRTAKKSIIAAFTVLVATAGMATAAGGWSFSGLRSFNISNISSIFQIFDIGEDDPPANIAQYSCDDFEDIFVSVELINLLGEDLAIRTVLGIGQILGFTIEQEIPLPGGTRFIICIGI